MIFFENEDKLGVIAKISQILADNKVNIVDFRLGSDHKGSALAVILIEDEISKDIIEKLKEIKECKWVAYASL